MKIPIGVGDVPDMDRFRAIKYLAFAIYGSEVIVGVANFMVFSKRTAMLLLFFSVICAVLVRYLVRAVQTATVGTARLAGVVLVLFIVPLALSAVTHLSLQRETDLANEIDTHNESTVSKYTAFVGQTLKDIKEIRAVEAKTAQTNNSTAKIITRNGGDPTKTVRPLVATNIDAPAILKKAEPVTQSSDRLQIIKEHMPLIWRPQVIGYVTLMLSCGILAFFWKHDRNQNGVDDEDEDEEVPEKRGKK